MTQTLPNQRPCSLNSCLPPVQFCHARIHLIYAQVYHYIQVSEFMLLLLWFPLCRIPIPIALTL